MSSSTHRLWSRWLVHCRRRHPHQRCLRPRLMCIPGSSGFVWRDEMRIGPIASWRMSLMTRPPLPILCLGCSFPDSLWSRRSLCCPPIGLSCGGDASLLTISLLMRFLWRFLTTMPLESCSSGLGLLMIVYCFPSE